MKLQTITAMMIVGLGSTLSNAASFNVSNSTSQQGGIFITFNGGSPLCPKGSTPAGGACCKFTSNKQSFSVSSGPGFSITANQCGSNGEAQAEFNVKASGKYVCPRKMSACDVVDASLEPSASTPTVTITGPGHTIDTGAKGCGIYFPGNNNCALQQPGQSATKCPYTNFCQIYFPANSSYTVTFQ